MTDHPRKTIRDALVALLDDAEIVAAGKCTASRKTSFGAADLPAITVYTLVEEVDESSWSTAPREYQRELTLAVVAFEKAGATESIDAKLDALALAIEEVVELADARGREDPATDALPSGLPDDIARVVLAGTEIEILAEGATDIAAIRLQYRVRYYTSMPTAVQQALEPFEGANVTISLFGATDDTPAVTGTVDVESE